MALYNFMFVSNWNSPEPPDRHSHVLLIDVLSGRPGRSANQRPLGQVALYNFQVSFGPELSGSTFARAHGRNAFESIGPMCKSQAPLPPT